MIYTMLMDTPKKKAINKAKMGKKEYAYKQGRKFEKMSSLDKKYKEGKLSAGDYLHHTNHLSRQIVGMKHS